LISIEEKEKKKASLRVWREAFVHLENPSYWVINKDPTLARNLSRLFIDFHRRERKEKSVPPFLELGFRSSRKSQLRGNQ
jgi:hypothetical protein